MRLFLAAILLLQQPARPAHRPIPALPLQRFIDDMRSKNLADILSLYTPDAVFVDPEHHTFATPQALRDLYQRVFATYDSDLTLHTHSIGVNDSNAVERGDYTEALRTRATGVVQHPCGGYIFTFHQQPDARWLISRMEWTSTPCPAAPTKQSP